jgi:dTDP-L-rhamnose 4-epimerase
VYGIRQALSNPYTGVLAIFASRLMNGNPPLIYEDGNQRRDFVNVKDVVAACTLACEKKEADAKVFNIGSGHSYTIKEIAERLAKVMERQHLKAKITSNYRAGDIRHCFANIDRARGILGYQPVVDLDSGLAELTRWLSMQKATDEVESAGKELEKRGLIIKQTVPNGHTEQASVPEKK